MKWTGSTPLSKFDKLPRDIAVQNIPVFQDLTKAFESFSSCDDLERVQCAEQAGR